MMRGKGGNKPDSAAASKERDSASIPGAKEPAKVVHAEDTDEPGGCADAGTMAWAERVLLEQPLVIGKATATEASAVSPTDINVDVSVDQGPTAGPEVNLVVG